MTFLLLSSLRNHLGRLLATAVAVMLSVAFIVTSLIVTSSFNSSLSQALTSELANTDVWVGFDKDAKVADQEAEFAKALPAIRAVPGVQAADPQVMAAGEFNHDGRRATGSISALIDPSLRWSTLAHGEWPDQPGEASIGESTAESLQLTVGDDVTIAPTGVAEKTTVRIVGVEHDTGGLTMGMPKVSLPADAFAALHAQSYTTAILVKGAAGSNPSELVSEVRSHVHNIPEIQVRDREAAAQHYIEDLSGNSASLLAMILAFVALSLVVAGYVIANTFQVLVAQRIKELALLRCIGAASNQIRTLILMEAALVGFVAAGFGVLLGVGLSALFTHMTRGAGSFVTITQLTINPSTPIIGIVTGVIVTVACAYGAARKATKVSPVTALHPMEATTQGTISRTRGIIGGLCAFVGGAGLIVAGQSSLLTAMGIDKSNSIFLGIGAGFLCLIGVLLLSALVLPPLIHMTGNLFARLSPTAELAAANSSRNPLRTAATATSLLIGVAVLVLMVVGINSTRASITAEIDNKRPVDLIVYSADAGFTPQELTAITTTHGVTNSAPVESSPITLNLPDGTEHQATAQGIDDKAIAKVLHKQDKHVVPAAGHVEVSADQFPTLHTGDQVTAFSDTDAVPLEVTVVDQGGGNNISLNYNDLRKLSTNRNTNQVFLQIDPALSANEVQTVISDLSTINPHFQVGGGAQERATYNSMLDTMLMVMIALLAVAIIIAIVGISNTTALSIIERRRESAMLRAVGLERRQLITMVVIEAVLTATVAAVCGTIIGMVFGWSGILALGNATTLALKLHIPTMQILLIIGAAALAGIMAALLPAWGASRRRPIADLAAN